MPLTMSARELAQSSRAGFSLDVEIKVIKNEIGRTSTHRSAGW